jgi:hypothetical protein
MKVVEHVLREISNKCQVVLLLIFKSIKILAIKIEVNNDVMIPINNVVAKPLIGPEPNINTAPVKMCVTRICN